MTKIELTENQARLFLLMSKAGVWDIHNGSFEVHVGKEGEPLKIDVHRHYRYVPKIGESVDNETLHLKA